jgi:hypothetical protein
MVISKVMPIGYLNLACYFTALYIIILEYGTKFWNEVFH